MMQRGDPDSLSPPSMDYVRLTMTLDPLSEETYDAILFPQGCTIENWQGKETAHTWENLVKTAFGAFVADWTAERFIESYASHADQFDPKGFFLIKKKNEFIASAFAWLPTSKADSGQVHWVCVLPQYQRQGIGKNVVKLVLRHHALKNRCKKAHLVTESFRTNAIAMYEKMGFKINKF
ncbi:mycothiol acetyltransferase-like [Oscarella lobularis]|uniref:mycothiol acetyltransferase-like n=1 Tax=Oscarella lobularis TaxID=121494 RepID=UPI003313DC4F